MFSVSLEASEVATRNRNAVPYAPEWNFGLVRITNADRNSGVIKADGDFISDRAFLRREKFSFSARR